MSNTVTLSLDLKAEFELNGESPEVLESNMRSAFDRAFSEGALTGSSEAEVNEYSLDVVVDPEGQIEKAAAILREKYGLGSHIATRMARAGLATPSAFVEMIGLDAG